MNNPISMQEISFTSSFSAVIYPKPNNSEWPRSQFECNAESRECATIDERSAKKEENMSNVSDATFRCMPVANTETRYWNPWPSQSHVVCKLTKAQLNVKNRSGFMFWPGLQHDFLLDQTSDLGWAVFGNLILTMVELIWRWKIFNFGGIRTHRRSQPTHFYYVCPTSWIARPRRT